MFHFQPAITAQRIDQILLGAALSSLVKGRANCEKNTEIALESQEAVQFGPLLVFYWSYNPYLNGLIKIGNWGYNV